MSVQNKVHNEEGVQRMWRDRVGECISFGATGVVDFIEVSMSPVEWTRVSRWSLLPNASDVLRRNMIWMKQWSNYSQSHLNSKFNSNLNCRNGPFSSSKASHQKQTSRHLVNAQPIASAPQRQQYNSEQIDIFPLMITALIQGHKKVAFCFGSASQLHGFSIRLLW